MKTNFTREARRGAKLLDVKLPGWWVLIDLTQLKMASCGQCVLGQLYGRYFHGLDAVSQHEHSIEVTHAFSKKHGFTIGKIAEPTFSEWRYLKAAWRDEIMKRREKDKAARRARKS